MEGSSEDKKERVSRKEGAMLMLLLKGLFRGKPWTRANVPKVLGLSPSFVSLAVTILLAGTLPTPVASQRARSQVEEGNRLYSEGRFEEAHQKYLEALLEDPESPLIRFNDGNALYQNQDFQRAMERFAEALDSPDPALRNSAWYNLGNALFRQQQLQESLEAFKEALRSDPGDLDAKHNLERVLEALQEQDQQDQQGEGDENQEDQPQDDQDQQDQPPGEQDQENPDQPPPQGQDSPQSEDQGQPEDNPQGDPQEGEAPPEEQEQQEGQNQPQPQPGEMTQEEAERLLDALREDPGDVNRKRAPSTGRRPRKDW